MQKVARYFPFLLTAVFALLLLMLVLAQPNRSGSIVTNNATVRAGSDITKIDINTADADTLAILPGVGSSLAKEIITYRKTHGSFTSIEQITEVPGIGKETFLQIQDYITVGG